MFVPPVAVQGTCDLRLGPSAGVLTRAKTTAPTMTMNERLEELLVRWEELRDQGHDVSPEELCRDCPAGPDGRDDVKSTVCPDPGGHCNGRRDAVQVPGYEILAVLGRGGLFRGSAFPSAAGGCGL